MEITLGALMCRDQFIERGRVKLMIVKCKQSCGRLNCIRFQTVMRPEAAGHCEFT
ncbi:hypothetical protein LMG28688_01296 [Paraburkholderia caffeinitolerans]|uniref:Uncharacterized protein n=1 Tax=Paraburkholderia caffeinitolerans TaxID=1723730 RepID=A0A6J5FP94_9BURK|nr:hypothetical protein LMG28688_01296 [Paraburkholderia caffeinitolerans]